MTTFNFTLGVPNPPDDPSDNVSDMRNNNDNISGIIDVDHVGFTFTNGGYHRDIHQPVFPIGGQTAWNPAFVSGVPTAVSGAKITGIQQLFPMNYTPAFAGATADTQLFSLSGEGGVSQLTGGNSIANGGWQWFGGILFIWGNGTIGGSPITFTAVSPTTIPFPNACFQVFTTPTATGANSSSYNIVITGKSATGFSYAFTGSAPLNITGFSWLAIGN